MREQFERAHASASSAQQQAKRDNDLAYNEKVPAINTLPKPTRKCMVSATIAHGRPPPWPSMSLDEMTWDGMTFSMA